MKFWRVLNGYLKVFWYFLKLIVIICKCLLMFWDEMFGEFIFLCYILGKNENNFKYFLVVFKFFIVLGVDIVLCFFNYLFLLKLFDNC